MFQGNEDFIEDYESLVEEFESEEPGWRARIKQKLRIIISRAEERALRFRGQNGRIETLDLWDVEVHRHEIVNKKEAMAQISGAIMDPENAAKWEKLAPRLYVYVSIEEGELLCSRLNAAIGETVNARFNGLTLLIHTKK